MISRVSRSLTAKLFLITAALIVAACALCYGFIAWFMPKTYQYTLSAELTEKAKALAGELETAKVDDCPLLLNAFVSDTGAEVAILGADGALIWQVGREYIMIGREGIATDSLSAAEVVEVAPDAQPEADESAITEDAPGVPPKAAVEDTAVVSEVTITASSGTGIASGMAGTSVVSYPFTLQETGEACRLEVYSDLREVGAAEVALGNTLPYLALVMLGVSLLGAVCFARFVTRPIIAMSRVAGRMAALDFSWRGDVRRRDEIGALGHSLNELADRLSAALGELRGEMERERDLARRRSELFRAVSHELKTPITVIKGQLEGMIHRVGQYKDRDATLSRSLQVAESMEAMVREIVALSRADGDEARLRPEPTRLGDALRECLAGHAELMRQRSIALDVDTDGSVEVMAGRALLVKAMGNLVSNAVLHAPEGARVGASVRRDGREAALTIENSGDQIPDDALPRLFEAFYRVDASRSRDTGGSGLGLYIAKGIFDAHGARCWIENAEGGVRAEVRFPLADHTETTH